PKNPSHSLLHSLQHLLGGAAFRCKDLQSHVWINANGQLLPLPALDAKGNPLPAIAQHKADARLAVLDHPGYLRRAMSRHFSSIWSISSKLSARPVLLFRSWSTSSISFRIRFCTSVFVVQLTIFSRRIMSSIRTAVSAAAWRRLPFVACDARD